MSWLRIALLSLAGPLLVASVGGAAPARSKEAVRAVPLPKGALARVGSLRLRHRTSIQLLAFSPDGRSLLSIGEGESLSIWEVATGRELRRRRLPTILPRPPEPELVQLGGRVFSRPLPSSSVALSPDGKRLALPGGDGVHLWDVEAAAQKRLYPLKGGALTVAFSADGKLLAAAGPGKETIICVWNVHSGKEVKRLRPPKGHPVHRLLFAPSGARLAAISKSDVIIWGLKNSKNRRTHQGHEGPVTSLAFHPDGKRLASGGCDNTVFLWGEDSEEEVGKLVGPESGMRVLAFSPDGRRLATGDGDNVVRLWDVDRRRLLKVLCSHGGAITVVAFSPNGTLLAVGGRDGHIRLWDVAKRKERFPSPDVEPVLTAAFTEGGRRLMLGSSDGVVRQADAATGKVLRRVTLPGNKTGLLFDPACRLSAFQVADSSEVRLWDVAAGKELRRLKPPQALSLVGFGPRGRLLAFVEPRIVAGTLSGVVRLWDTTTGQPLRKLNVAATELAFAPNGKVVAIPTEGRIGLWEVATGERRCLLTGSSGAVACLVFSPDGRWLAAAGNEEIVRLWDVQTGELRRALTGHTEGIRALAFSPDGKRLASGSADQTVILWDVATGEPLRRLEGHRGTVQTLAFAADGKRLVSVSEDTTALVWDLATPPRPKPLATVRPLEALWADLGRDARTAFAANRALADQPFEAVSFLSEKLLPVTTADPAVIARLIKDLDSRRFPAREQAMHQLAQLGGQAEAALRKTLSSRPSAEVAKRLKELLARLERPTLSPRELRAARALELLEQIDAPGSRRLLRVVAGGAPGAWLTREAREAVDRSRARSARTAFRDN